MTLKELAKACEAATGPDGALERAIDRELHGSIMATEHRYTASVDAAATLVPSGIVPQMRAGTWWWSVETLGCEAHVAYENGDSGIIENGGKGATPALALCAAALKCRDEVQGYYP